MPTRSLLPACTYSHIERDLTSVSILCRILVLFWKKTTGLVAEDISRKLLDVRGKMIWVGARPLGERVDVDGYFFRYFGPSVLFSLLRRPLKSRVISAFFVNVYTLPVSDGNFEEVIKLWGAKNIVYCLVRLWLSRQPLERWRSCQLQWTQWTSVFIPDSGDKKNDYRENNSRKLSASLEHLE